MLNMTPEAVQFILSRNCPFYIDVPPAINCCIHLVDTPAINSGTPREADNFDILTVDGATVYVPKDFPTHPMRISITSFLGRKKLVLEGWHLA